MDREMAAGAGPDEELTMLDTTPITTAIAAMIRTGTSEAALLAAVARQFPQLVLV